MRLVPLFEMTHRYTEVTWVGPLPGGDSVAWALREGAVEGERIRGTHRAFNRPRRRADEVSEPHAVGLIRTHDGIAIEYEIRGYGVPAAPGDPLRRVVGAVTFRVADERYAWLNTTLALLEGRYEREADGNAVGRFRVYECVPEAEPPSSGP